MACHPRNEYRTATSFNWTLGGSLGAKFEAGGNTSQTVPPSGRSILWSPTTPFQNYTFSEGWILDASPPPPRGSPPTLVGLYRHLERTFLPHKTSGTSSSSVNSGGGTVKPSLPFNQVVCSSWPCGKWRRIWPAADVEAWLGLASSARQQEPSLWKKYFLMYKILTTAWTAMLFHGKQRITFIALLPTLKNITWILSVTWVPRKAPHIHACIDSTCLALPLRLLSTWTTKSSNQITSKEGTSSQEGSTTQGPLSTYWGTVRWHQGADVTLCSVTYQYSAFGSTGIQ